MNLHGFGPRPEAALLLLGHGSTVHCWSSAPVRAHTATLAASGLFGEVACGFWKEGPGMQEALARLTKPEVYLVPFFTVEGYFVRKVIPEVLQLEGWLTRRDGRILKLCRPVGAHPRLTEVLLHRAASAAPGVDPARAALLILGHGTPRDARSSEGVERQVAEIRRRGLYAEVVGAFMETPPLIRDWTTLTSARDVIAVPFFMADGLHGDEDIPRLLGLEPFAGGGENREECNPHLFGERRLHYSRAVGSDPGMVQVILDQIAACDRALL